MNSSHKGEIATLLTLGLVLVGAVITLVSSMLVKSNKIAMGSRASTCTAGVPIPNSDYYTCSANCGLTSGGNCPDYEHNSIDKDCTYCGGGGGTEYPADDSCWIIKCVGGEAQKLQYSDSLSRYDMPLSSCQGGSPYSGGGLMAIGNANANSQLATLSCSGNEETFTPPTSVPAPTIGNGAIQSQAPREGCTRIAVKGRITSQQQNSCTSQNSQEVEYSGGKYWCCPPESSGGKKGTKTITPENEPDITPSISGQAGMGGGGINENVDICKDIYGEDAYCPTNMGGTCFTSADKTTETECRVNGSTRHCCVPGSISPVDFCYSVSTDTRYKLGEQVCVDNSHYQVCQNNAGLITEWSQPTECSNCFSQIKGKVTCNTEQSGQCKFNNQTYNTNDQRCDTVNSYVQCFSTGVWSSSANCLSCQEKDKKVTCAKKSTASCQQTTGNSNSYCDKLSGCILGYEFYKNNLGNTVNCSDGSVNGKCCISTQSNAEEGEITNGFTSVAEGVSSAVSGAGRVFLIFVPGLGQVLINR